MQITKWPPFIKPFWERKRRKWWDICLNLRSQQAFWCARKCPGVGRYTMWALRCVFLYVFVAFLSVFYHLGDIFYTNWIMCKTHNFCARFLLVALTIVFLCQIREAHWRVKLNKKYEIDCSYCKPLLAAETDNYYARCCCTSRVQKLNIFPQQTYTITIQRQRFHKKRDAFVLEQTETWLLQMSVNKLQ